MKKILTSVAAGAALSATAMAGMEPIPMQETTNPGYNWTGFYFGLQVGINFEPDTDGGLEFDSNLDGNFSDNVPFGAPDNANAFRQNFDHEFDEAFSYGVHIGYDRQINSKWVIGALLDYNHTDILESQNGFSGTPAFYKEERSIENLATLRLRAGYLVTDATLVYVTGGLAYGDPEYVFNSNNPNGTSRGDIDSNFGFVIGAGVETRLNQNWSLGVEYLYTNFGDGDFTTSFNNGPFAAQSGATDTRGTEEDFDFHTLQLKLTYRF